jgi:FKBP-type peptidyl-prolyl cis-trans isomerase SlpA
MTSTAATVAPESFVTLHYRLSGPAGVVIDTFAQSPATLTLGTGVLAPALESRLLGLPEGTRQTFELPAGEVFGQRNPQMVQWLDRQVIDDMSLENETLAVGEVLQFPTPDNQAHFAGVVRDFKDTEQGQAVLLDFNHPLAGQPVRFEVHVIGVL